MFPSLRQIFFSYFGFPVSIGFHQCSMLIFLLLQKEKTAKYGNLNKNAVSNIWKNWTYEDDHSFNRQILTAETRDCEICGERVELAQMFLATSVFSSKCHFTNKPLSSSYYLYQKNNRASLSTFKWREWYHKHFLLFQLMHTIIKIIEILKQFKIITLATTCFGSRRNPRQGTVLCLVKTTARNTTGSNHCIILLSSDDGHSGARNMLSKQ
jgi:hypothetical protein